MAAEKQRQRKYAIFVRSGGKVRAQVVFLEHTKATMLWL